MKSVAGFAKERPTQTPMKKSPLLVAISLLLFLVLRAEASISVGPAGVGPLTFSTNPIVTEFSTSVMNGFGGTFNDVADVSAAIAVFSLSNHAPGFVPLLSTMTWPPSGDPGGFRYNNNATFGGLIQSRPVTTGTNAANLLLATFRNDSGAPRNDHVLSYDFSLATTASLGLDDELPGFHVFYSVTGAAGSWQPVPGLTATEAQVNHSGSIRLDSWPVGGLLYVLWFDDNDDGQGDPPYTIDNLRLIVSDPPPRIVSQPLGVTNLVGRTVGLSVTAQGIGLQYRWHKVGQGPIDSASATTSTLVISNAQLNDTGDYFVIVSNGFGPSQSSNAHVEILPDIYPPKLLAAGVSNLGSNLFNLVVDEPVCTDALACGANATCTSNWQIVPLVNGIEGADLVVAEVTVNGTNLVFRTLTPHQAGKQYRLKVAGDCDGGINDVFGNQLVAGQPGSTIDVPFPLPRLSIAASGSNAVVSWPADSSWVLQRANAVNGPYATVDPTSGLGVHTNVTAGNATNLFFRLRYQPEP